VLSSSWADLSATRKKFEARPDFRCKVRERLKQPAAASSRRDHLLSLMRQKGGGSVRIAWRRYFDSDCDGELTFREFCRGLAIIGYYDDTIALWHDLGGSKQRSITLHAVDASGAAILDYFGNWCYGVLGGPYEVFSRIDSDGSDSLTQQEFLDGMEELGFFEAKDVPDRIATVELARRNLFPVLDATGRGTLSARDLLFIERDKSKRERIKRDLNYIELYGRQAMARPLPKSADKLLSKTAGMSFQSWSAVNTLESPLRKSRRFLPRQNSAPCGNRQQSLGFPTLNVLVH